MAFPGRRTAREGDPDDVSSFPSWPTATATPEKRAADRSPDPTGTGRKARQKPPFFSSFFFSHARTANWRPRMCASWLHLPTAACRVPSFGTGTRFVPGSECKFPLLRGRAVTHTIQHVGYFPRVLVPSRLCRRRGLSASLSTCGKQATFAPHFVSVCTRVGGWMVVVQYRAQYAPPPTTHFAMILPRIPFPTRPHGLWKEKKACLPPSPP